MCVGAIASGVLGMVGAGQQARAAERSAGVLTDYGMQARDLQEQRLAQQLALQEQMYNTGRSDLAPYRNAGIPAIGAANYLLGLGNAPMVGGTTPQVTSNEDGTFSVGGQTFDNIGAAEAWAAQNPEGGTPYAFSTTPGYQFAVKENLDAIEGSAAARGGLYSGAAMQALGERANSLANLEFGNNFNRVMSVAGLGANAAGQTAQMGMQNAQLGSNSLANDAAMGSQTLTGIGNAQAAGIVGAANARAAGLNDLSGLFGYMGNSWGGGGSTPTAASMPAPSYSPMPMTSYAPAPTYAPPPVYSPQAFPVAPGAYGPR
jgi:hypothetical protein